MEGEQNRTSKIKTLHYKHKRGKKIKSQKNSVGKKTPKARPSWMKL